MKQRLLFLLAVLTLAACSSPKYTYNFDRYRYQSNNDVAKADEIAVLEGPASIDPAELVASSDVAVLPPVEASTVENAPVRKTYVQMNKQERKALRKHIKAEVKTFIKEKRKELKDVRETKLMDEDLKLAAIFGAVGFTGLILSGVGEAFTIIGAIALLIGVVFFVKWLVRQ